MGTLSFTKKQIQNETYPGIKTKIIQSFVWGEWPCWKESDFNLQLLSEMVPNDQGNTTHLVLNCCRFGSFAINHPQLVALWQPGLATWFTIQFCRLTYFDPYPLLQDQALDFRAAGDGVTFIYDWVICSEMGPSFKCLVGMKKHWKTTIGVRIPCSFSRYLQCESFRLGSTPCPGGGWIHPNDGGNREMISRRGLPSGNQT